MSQGTGAQEEYSEQSFKLSAFSQAKRAVNILFDKIEHHIIFSKNPCRVDNWASSKIEKKIRTNPVKQSQWTFNQKGQNKNLRVASPQTKSVRSFRSNFKKNASNLGNPDLRSQASQKTLQQEPKSIPVKPPEYDFGDQLNETDIERLRIWKQNDNRRKKIMEEEERRKKKHATQSLLSTKYKTKPDEVNEQLTYNSNGNIMEIVKVKPQTLKKLQNKIVRSTLNDTVEKELNKLGQAIGLSKTSSQMVSQNSSLRRSSIRRKSMDEINLTKQSKQNKTSQSIPYIEGDNVFSQHPRKVFRPQLGVTYKDKSGCQLKKTDSDHPNLAARRTMTRLQYSALEENSPNRNRLFNGVNLMRKTSFNPESNGQMSATVGKKFYGSQVSKKGSNAKMGSFADYLDNSYHESIAQVNDYENMNEQEKINNKIKQYHTKFYMTNTTKLSQNLMTSTSMTFSKRKGKKSTMQEWVLKDPTNIKGTKVTNFRKAVPPLKSILTPFEKINSQILNDTKWGDKLTSGVGGGATLYTKFPKYLPKIIKRDSSLLNGTETSMEMYGNRTHTRRMSGFSTNLKKFNKDIEKLHHSSIGEL